MDNNHNPNTVASNYAQYKAKAKAEAEALAIAKDNKVREAKTIEGMISNVPDVKAASEAYSNADYNHYAIKKALTAFDEANNDRILDRSNVFIAAAIMLAKMHAKNKDFAASEYVAKTALQWLKIFNRYVFCAESSSYVRDNFKLTTARVAYAAFVRVIITTNLNIPFVFTRENFDADVDNFNIACNRYVLECKEKEECEKILAGKGHCLSKLCIKFCYYSDNQLARNNALQEKKNKYIEYFLTALKNEWRIKNNCLIAASAALRKCRKKATEYFDKQSNSSAAFTAEVKSAIAAKAEANAAINAADEANANNTTFTQKLLLETSLLRITITLV